MRSDGRVSEGRFRVDWEKRRRRMHSVLINNLSIRVPTTALWDSFNAYGIVRDVFIQRKIQGQATYAFVRYNEASEARNAILRANHRVIDGLVIRVQVAIAKGSVNYQPRLVQQKKGVSHSVIGSSHSSGAWRDARSYKEAAKGVKPRPLPPSVPEGGPKVSQAIPELIYESERSSEMLRWLGSCAVGKLRCLHHQEEIQNLLAKEGIEASVRPYGGLCVFMSFPDTNQMQFFLRNYGKLLQSWFSSITPWEKSRVCKERFKRLRIEGIPPHLWEEDFFRKLGDLWGTFVATDSCTQLRKRFDFATVLVSTDDSYIIPSSMAIHNGGQRYLLQIHQEVVLDIHEVLPAKVRDAANAEDLSVVPDSSPSSKDEVVGDSFEMANEPTPLGTAKGGDNHCDPSMLMQCPNVHEVGEFNRLSWIELSGWKAQHANGALTHEDMGLSVAPFLGNNANDPRPLKPDLTLVELVGGSRLDAHTKPLETDEVHNEVGYEPHGLESNTSKSPPSGLLRGCRRSQRQRKETHLPDFVMANTKSGNSSRACDSELHRKDVVKSRKKKGGEKHKDLVISEAMEEVMVDGNPIDPDPTDADEGSKEAEAVWDVSKQIGFTLDRQKQETVGCILQLELEG